jgi:hypothetical protein
MKDKIKVNDCSCSSDASKMLKPEIKRYNLAIPKELFDDLQSLAKSEHTTILDLIRRFIKLGLIAAKMEKDPNAKIFIHENDHQRELVFFA